MEDVNGWLGTIGLCGLDYLAGLFSATQFPAAQLAVALRLHPLQDVICKAITRR